MFRGPADAPNRQGVLQYRLIWHPPALIADLRRELEEQRRHLARAKQLLAIVEQSDAGDAGYLPGAIGPGG